MDKHNNLATLNKRKINYFKILAWIGFIFSIFLFWKISSRIISVSYSIKYSFPNINSEEPLIILNSIIIFVGIISLVIILLTDNMSNKIMNLTNKTYDNSKEKMCTDIKNINSLYTPKIMNTKNIKILAFLSLLLSIILFLVIHKYYFSHLRIGLFENHSAANYPGILLGIIIVYIGSVSFIFLWILSQIMNTIKLIGNDLIIFEEDIKKIDSNSEKNYIKIFACCIFILSILFFIYLAKEYLSQENFKYWQGSYNDITKTSALISLFSIVYVGAICSLLLLLLGNVHYKIKNIKIVLKNICYKQDKSIEKANKSSIFKGVITTIIAVLNASISVYFILYLKNYFNKQFVFLLENVQDPLMLPRNHTLANNQITTILIIVILCSAFTILMLLLKLSNISKDISLIEVNIDMFNKK